MSTTLEAPVRAKPRKRRLPGVLRVLGPGLITGAADDDPSGVSTYTTAGASFGYGLLWTAPFSLPLMIAVQLMCARIGMVSGRGLAGVIRTYYPRWLLWSTCSVLVVANTVNIGADLAAMAAVSELITGMQSALWAPGFAALILALLVYETYPIIARVFKWLTLALFAYVLTAFLADPPWTQVLRATLIPSIALNRDWIIAFVAIFGTTISPYLFFWQAAEEVEVEKALGRTTVQERQGATRAAIRNATMDVVAGMTISNLIFYFIIVATAATLHASGLRDIQTAQDAAEALRPLAGNGAALLFALGILGTGLLGVSVLTGASALAIAEAAEWRGGMSERMSHAPEFYATMALSLGAGVLISLLDINPIQMLLWAAVLNGVLAPPLIVLVIAICNNRTVMGEFCNGRALNTLGLIAAAIMTLAAIVLLMFLI